MNDTMKALQKQAEQHMAGIVHDRLGASLCELVRLFPHCEVTAIPVHHEETLCGYRFRVALRDGSSDSGSFTIPTNQKHVFDVIA